MTRRDVGIVMMMLGVLMIALTFMLTGCLGNRAVKRNEPELQTTSERFIANNDLYWFDTMVDTHTGVTYLLWHDGNRGGITVLVNRDGSPVISEEVAPVD